MQTVFHRQLDALTATIADRCALAGCVAQGARHALLQPDGALAEDVISEYTKIAGTAASAEWAASLSISATRPKMLCNPAIHAKSVT